MKLAFTFCSLSLLVAVTSHLLDAQSFFGGGVSARTAAQAGIYVPSSDNVIDALALNPAGLARLSGPTLNLTLTGLRAGGSFSNASNVNSSMEQNMGLVPFGAFGLPIGNSRWTLGFGITPDLLSSAKWRYHDTPGTAGVSYGQQSEKSRIQAFRSAAVLSFAVTPRISLGATVGAVYNSNTLDSPYIFQSQPVLKGLKTLLDLHTTGVGWSTSWGIIAKLTRKLEIGAAYRTSTSITSNGYATGNLDALFKALGVAADPTFNYDARVKLVLPQSVLANLAWQFNPRLRLSLQGDWTDWKSSFQQLPVNLTKGTNAVVNSLLQSGSLNDAAPLNWKQQFTVRTALERRMGENVWLSGGFLHSNNPVPGSTLSPLTAAIMQNRISGGVGYTKNRYRFDLSYSVNLNANLHVTSSALAGGEYSNSQVRVNTQALTLSTSFHL